MMRIYYLPLAAFVLLLALLLTGCTSRRIDDDVRQFVIVAKQNLDKDKPEPSISVFSNVPRKSINEVEAKAATARSVAEAKATTETLGVIEALLKNGDYNHAKKYIETIGPDQLSTSQLNTLKLFKGQLYLHAGKSLRAIEQLQSITLQALDDWHKLAYFQSLAFAYALNQQWVESIKARIALSNYLIEAKSQANNYRVILATLKQLSAPSLANLEASDSEVLSGWASLATLLKSSHIGSEHTKIALNDWRYRYPGHPVQSVDFEVFNHSIINNPEQLSNIAVLLPSSGSYAQAALAIKAGLMAAIRYRNGTGSLENIHFYNANSNDIQRLYRQLADNGVDLIIGPLQKKNILQLAQLSKLNIPVLALNRLPEVAKNQLFQFGLSPEDEAEQIAHKAFDDGYRTALILVPDTSLGLRIANALNIFWQQAGGVVLETQAYHTKTMDFSQPIKQLLNLNESISRAQNINQLFPEVQFTPRRRRDADVIFVAGRPQEVRLINPQLRYYRAGELPVYAMPQVYTGLPNPSLDIDLNNITFCDIPWLLVQNPQEPLSLQTLQTSWQQFPDTYIRLFAMGIDAYNMVPHLGTLTTNYYLGATGYLSLSSDNHIKRQLVCAKFINGIPELLNHENTDDVHTDL